MCSICFEQFKPYDDLYSTDCGHIYHFVCVQQWQSRSSCCPQCRAYKPKIHRIYLELKDMKEYDVKKFNQIQIQLNESHVEVIKLKEVISKTDEEKKDLEETLKDALTHNEELRERLETLELKLQLSYLNKIKHDVNNNNENGAYEKPNEKLNQNVLVRDTSIQIQPQQQPQQQQQQQDPIIQLETLSLDRSSIWFISQTSEGNCQLKGPFKTISDGIIAAKKQTLQETGLTIEGIDDAKANQWFNWLREMQLSPHRATMLLEEHDIIKTHYMQHERKLFVQFRTAEWRNRFLQITNEDHENCNVDCGSSSNYSMWGQTDYNISSNPHTMIGVRFTNEISAQSLATYDTLYEYAKTLKVVGFKRIYGYRGNVFVKRAKNSPPIMIKHKKQVDDLMKAELNL